MQPQQQRGCGLADKRSWHSQTWPRRRAPLSASLPYLTGPARSTRPPQARHQHATSITFQFILSFSTPALIFLIISMMWRGLHGATHASRCSPSHLIFLHSIQCAFACQQIQAAPNSCTAERVAPGPYPTLIHPARVAPGRELAVVKGHLALEGVHFAYPQRAEAPVFAGFSLDVQPGASLALVGMSGSGKCVPPTHVCPMLAAIPCLPRARTRRSFTALAQSPGCMRASEQMLGLCMPACNVSRAALQRVARCTGGAGPRLLASSCAFTT